MLYKKNENNLYHNHYSDKPTVQFNIVSAAILHRDTVFARLMVAGARFKGTPPPRVKDSPNAFRILLPIDRDCDVRYTF